MSALEKEHWCARLLAELAKAKTQMQADAIVRRALSETPPAVKPLREQPRCAACGRCLQSPDPDAFSWYRCRCETTEVAS